MSNWRTSACDKKHGTRAISLSASSPFPRPPRTRAAGSSQETFGERRPSDADFVSGAGDGLALCAHRAIHDARPGNQAVLVPCVTRHAPAISACIRAISGIRLGPVRAARSGAPQRTPHGGGFYSQEGTATHSRPSDSREESALSAVPRSRIRILRCVQTFPGSLDDGVEGEAPGRSEEAERAHVLECPAEG